MSRKKDNDNLSTLDVWIQTPEVPIKKKKEDSRGCFQFLFLFSREKIQISWEIINTENWAKVQRKWSNRAHAK